MPEVKCNECSWTGEAGELVKGECLDDDRACPQCFGTTIEGLPVEPAGEFVPQGTETGRLVVGTDFAAREREFIERICAESGLPEFALNPPPIEKVYVVVIRGDQTLVRLVPESALKATVHDALCTCDAKIVCESAGVSHTLQTLDNKDYWEPGGVEWFEEFEDGSVTVYELTDMSIMSLMYSRDVHAETAARLFKVRPDQVNTEQRRFAQKLTFGALYGRGREALANLSHPMTDTEAMLRLSEMERAGARIDTDKLRSWVRDNMKQEGPVDVPPKAGDNYDA